MEGGGRGEWGVVISALIGAIKGCCGIEPSQTFLKLCRCVKEKRKRHEGRKARMRGPCGAVVIFSWEREEC